MSSCAVEAADKETAADEQRERQRHLRDDERIRGAGCATLPPYRGLRS